MATDEKKITWCTWAQKLRNYLSYDPVVGQKSFHDFQRPPKVRNLYDLMHHEYSYPRWFSLWHMVQSFKFLTEDTCWNSLICVLAAAGIVLVAVELDHYSIYTELADLVYNVAYLVNMLSLAYFCLHTAEIGISSLLGFVIDLVSYLHYIVPVEPRQMEIFKLICYYLRLHRPFQFLRALDDYNLKSSVTGTAFKYLYIFFIVRITCGLLWLPLLPTDLYDKNNGNNTTATTPEWNGTTTSGTGTTPNLIDNTSPNWTGTTANWTGTSPKWTGTNPDSTRTTPKWPATTKSGGGRARDFSEYYIASEYFNSTVGNKNFTGNTSQWTSGHPGWSRKMSFWTSSSSNGTGSQSNWIGTQKWTSTAQSSMLTSITPQSPRSATSADRPRRYMIYKLMQSTGQDDPFYAAKRFFGAFYIINKMFIPVGPPVGLNEDLERVVSILVMMSGCLIVSGAATASLSLTISMYLRPEENFRTRYRLIVQEMMDTKVPEDLRDKVDTFYKMYWHKEKGVSASRLLPTFPPCLHAYVIMDIYFEAMQKSRILQDLSSQFLSEVAKCMETVHYIPGDPIIKRSSKKSSIIYITYGDVEMLTAEDDCTPVLRMTRGTMLSGYGACAPVACARAHCMIRAATFCVAHVLHAPDLWYMAWRRGRLTGQGDIIQQAFFEHFEKVKSFHEYDRTVPLEPKYKSSIMLFKQNLMALKEACDSSGQQILGQTDVFLEIAGSYIMRNREDISLSDDADAICLRPTFPCILQPSSSLMAAWTWFMAIVIIGVSFAIPFQLVFNQEITENYRFYNYVITGLYLVDIAVHLSTGDNVEEGVPITFTQTSSQQMRSAWFFVDVLATVPIFEFIGDGHFAGLNKLLRIIKAFRTFNGLEEVLAYESKFLRMMSYMIALIFVTFFVGVLQQGFMCYEFSYCVVANVTTIPYWTNRSLINATEQEMDDTLFFSLYWAANIITFTTHIDTLGMLNWTNAVYTIFILEICIVMHMFIEALYSANIMVTSGLSEQYESMITDVKNVFMKSEVEPQLQERYITYLQLCWYTDKAYSMTHQKKTIFFDLPQHVYQNIMSRERSKYILSIPFMKFFNHEDLKKISSNCTMFYTSPNEILLCSGDISSEMYILKQGICEMLNPDTHECDMYLKAKDHFGVLDSLLRIPAFYTVRAITHVQVISVPRKYLLEPIAATPQLRETIEFVKHQPEYRTMLVRRERFISFEPLPPTPNREFFPLPRRHESDHEYMHPFKQLGALSILRYISPRFTIRPDGHYLIRYEVIHACCAFTSAMIVPGYCYLVLDWPQLYYVLWMLDIAAYFDILQRMIVGYFNSHGVIIYHPASTAAHYLKGPFLIDLLACLPLENMVQPKRQRFRLMFQVSQIKQCWMFNRLVQLYRLPSAMMVLEKFVERKDILLILKALPIFLTMLNVLTCLMVFHSSLIYHDKYDVSVTIKNAKGATWFKMMQDAFRFNATSSPTYMHLACYFWVVYASTTTGYNTIKPYDPDQMIVIITGMMLGTLITTYVSVRIISIRANVNTLLAEYQENMKDIITYMHAEHLDKILKREVLNYFSHNWEKLGGVDYRLVLKMCHQINLRTDAVLHLYGSTFAKCPLLADSDVALLRILGRTVRSMYFLKNTRLYEVSDILKTIYIVDYGSVKMKIGYDDTRQLIRGSIFGNLQGPNSILCPFEAMAESDIHLLQINAKAFHNIISDFPSVRRKMMRLCQQGECFIEGIDLDQASVPKVKEKVMRQVVSFFHYNYAIIQVYLILVSFASVLADMYNVGFQINTLTMMLVLYGLDAAFYGKVVILIAIPTVAGTDYDLKKLLEGTATSYYKSELRYDIVSCLPIEAFCLIAPKGSKRLIWFSFLRLNRIFRIVTIYKRLMQYHEQLHVNLTLTTVASTLIWFILFIHAATCLWYFIAIWQETYRPKSSWIYDNDGISHCKNAYVCALYFVFTTFTQNGVGDIMPMQVTEVVFVCILMVTSVMLSMIYVGEFSNIIQYKSFRSFAYYCKYLELQEFMKNNRVSSNLVKLVNRYAVHLWRDTRGEQLPYFLKKAPYCLKLKIMSGAYMKHLVANKMFMDCEPAFLRQLVCYLRLYSYNEDMFVVKQGEITDCMYIIHKGQVAECTEEDTYTGRVFNGSDQFGLLQGLRYDSPFPYSYRTTWKSQVLSLNLRDWEQLMILFPLSRGVIYSNIARHQPDDWPPTGDPSFADELYYKDKRKFIFPSAAEREETQTGETFQHDYRKFHFDQNLESSTTSFRLKSALNAEEPREQIVNEQASTNKPSEPTTKQVKSIMKHESVAASDQTTESEAMVDKFEKHIATVEFDDYISKSDKHLNKQKEEEEEKLIATIDMDKKDVVSAKTDIKPIIKPMESSVKYGIEPVESATKHNLEQVESDVKHQMIPYKANTDEAKLVTTINLDQAKRAQLMDARHESINREDRRGEEFETLVDIYQDSDGEELKHPKPISKNKNYIDDNEEDKLDDNEEEITTITMDQERDLILVKHPMIHANELKDKSNENKKEIVENSSGKKNFTTIDIHQYKDNALQKRSKIVPILKEHHDKIDVDGTSNEKLVTTIDKDQLKVDSMLKRLNFDKTRHDELNSVSKTNEKHVKLKLDPRQLDQIDKREQEFIAIDMDQDLEVKRLRRVRESHNEDKKQDQELDQEDIRGEQLVNVIDVNHENDETAKKVGKDLVWLNKSTTDDNLTAAHNDYHNFHKTEEQLDREDRIREEVLTKSVTQNDILLKRRIPRKDQHVGDTEQGEKKSKTVNTINTISEEEDRDNVVEEDETRTDKEYNKKGDLTIVNMDEDKDIIDLRNPMIGQSLEEYSEEILVDPKSGEKLITAVASDEDDIIPLKRETRQFYDTTYNYQKEPKQSDQKHDKLKIKLAESDAAQLQLLPYGVTDVSQERNETKEGEREKEVISINIDNSKVAPITRFTQLRKVSKTIYSEGEEEEIMATVDMDTEKYKSPDDTNKKVADKEDDTGTNHHVKY